MSHLETIENDKLNILFGLVLDLDNIAFTLKHELKQLTTERNFVLEDVYNSIYHVSNNNNYSCCYYFKFNKLILF